ncbi:ABC transporter ATP-binding protein [Pseudothermotoga sp.]|nr:ABC transporter ATP-binding protein [Pseudothermotoga sp.]MCX7812717.1 ABC transporter ATP-binding protein [Pseudothermotoga sp.]MDW8138997.1 ABC transporter ATP-binding protein [Pseudothermotoga sp.]
MVEVLNLVKSYFKRGSKEKIKAVDNVSFNIKLREIFALLGPNGAGKTTIIKSVCGLIIPDSGEIRIKGHSVLKERSKALSQISAVLEGNRNLYWRMSVLENMRYFAGIRGKKLTKSKALEILSIVGLEEQANQLVHSLSRGTQQKAAIAVCLACDTEVLLLDEPTLGLDVHSAVEFRSILRSLKEQGKTILLSTHDMNLVEAVADRVAIMNKGKIVVCEEKQKLVDIFTARTYRLKLFCDNESKQRLKALGFDGWIEDGNLIELQINLPSSRKLYDLIDTFRSNNIEIESIEKEMVNFEKIFISYTRE